MMHRVIQSFLIAFISLGGFSLALAENDNSGVDFETGAKLFQQCSACHMASGEGVKGAFPPLRGRLAVLSADESGRHYLMSVLLTGLSGAIEVDGQTYNGFMQAYGQSLSNAELSAVLNYVAMKITDAAVEGFQPYREDEFATMRSRLKTDPRTSLQLRNDAIK